MPCSARSNADDNDTQGTVELLPLIIGAVRDLGVSCRKHLLLPCAQVCTNSVVRCLQLRMSEI